MKSADLQALRHSLERICPLTPEAWTALAALTKPRGIEAGQHLLRAGAQATQIFFLNSGLLREYYVDADGQQATRRFCTAHEFSGSLADLLSQRAADVSIEVLAGGDIIAMDWTAVDALSLQHASLMQLMRRFAEGLYIQKMRREFEMLTLPAAQRYQRFTEALPVLNAQLPRHMVASYLGITPVHLSRIGAAQKSSQSPVTQTGKT